MDYNDNDYEGQDLHLAGEESSKLSSALRPFALPKFDFDDSLHGHIRFDSLVENEVFLGISNQDDSQWIEDFSRGSSGIGFSSGATESCALPRCNNVWSEATSSESVEMLLKSVGQEEIVTGVSMTEKSYPTGPLGSSTGQMETNLKRNDNIDDVGVISLIPLAEGEGNISGSNQSARIEGATLQVHERNLSSYEVSVDDKESSSISISANRHTDTGRTSEDEGGVPDLGNDSLCKQVQENLLDFGKGIDNIGGSSQKHDANSGDQDKISDTSFVSSICISEGNSEGVEENKGDSTANDETLGSETVIIKEDQAVEIKATDFGGTSSRSETGESVSKLNDCKEVDFVAEPADGGGRGIAVFSSGPGIKCSSGDTSVLNEKSSIYSQGGGCLEGPSIKGSSEASPVNLKQKMVPLTQPMDQPRSPACDADNYPRVDSSLESSRATFGSTIFAEVPCKPSELDSKSTIDLAAGTGNSQDLSFAGECGGDNSMIEVRNVRNAAVIQKESVEDRGHLSPPLLAGSTQTCEEDNFPIQADLEEDDLAVSAFEEDDKKSPHGSSNVVSDDVEKDVGFNSSGEGANVNVESASELQPNPVTEDHQVSNSEVEDTKPISASAEGDEVAGSNEHNSPSFDIGHRDQSKELVAAKDTSSSRESLEPTAEVAPAADMENKKLFVAVADAEAGKMDDLSVPLVDIPNTTMPDEATRKLSKEIDRPAGVLIVEDDASKALHAEKPIEPIIESSGTNSAIVSGSISAVEIDVPNQHSMPLEKCSNTPQNEIDEKENLKSDNVENVGEVLPTSMNQGVNALSKEQETFTFDVRPLGGQPAADSDEGSQSFPRIQACVLPLTGEGSPSTSGSTQKDTGIVKEISRGNSLMPSDGGQPSEGVKCSSERKTRRGSGKTVKEGTKKGNGRGKSSTSLSPLGAGQVMTFESAAKPRGAVSIPTSSMPNFSTTSSSAIFQQPFTDLQQVQLRAQIFVYGSLIQGAAPDEAFMVSAFDGGRNVWEPSWHACIERLRGKKYQANKIETPLSSRSGAKASDQTSRQGTSQGEHLSSTVGGASDKGIPSPAVNQIISLSSPLWNISTPSSEGLPSRSTARCAVFDYQAVSPLHPYQTPPTRNFTPHTTSWLSQPPFPVPWLTSSQNSPFDIGANYSAFPITESVKLTPVNETLHISSGGKHVTPIPAIHTGATTVFAGTPSLTDTTKRKGSTVRSSVETKTRKRKKSSDAEDVVHNPATASLVDVGSAPAGVNLLPKKVPAVEDPGRISLIERNQADPISSKVVNSHYSTPVAVPTPSSFMSIGTSEQVSSTLPTLFSNSHLQRCDSRVEKRTLNLETFGKVEEAKLQAEEAAAHAALAVSHCEGVWSKLDQQKSSGLTIDAEAKLASAAVAIAAAASVAKAAAAAAKIASSVAVQAKQMADEAVTRHETSNITELNTTSVYNSWHATPVSNVKGAERSNVSVVAISAAREAARKRVEAATAASRHAENLDAIVKAAELAAEAVSHTGKIVGIGDPFSLNELVKSGPDGYWKVSNIPSVPGSIPNDMNNILHWEVDAGVHTTGTVVPPFHGELSGNVVDDHSTVDKNLVSSVGNGEKSFQPQKEKAVSVSTEALITVPEINSESETKCYIPGLYGGTASIKEGSVVEVLKDHGDLKQAWFPANILSLKDGRALVCYSDLQSDEGSEQLKEWVSLEVQGGQAPVIRIPHPMGAVPFEGTRKRRRSDMKNSVWSIGDRVDAWVKDCWREGIIAEKNKKDPSTLVVNFPAVEEMLNVKVWHLRPTVIWSDSQWTECCSQGESGTFQGDTPVEKRQKLGSTGIESKSKGIISKNIDFVPEKTEEAKLPLSANENVFSIGSTRDEKKPTNVRTMRSGLQKEGPRVVFGVPRPGKKRKFMEVSKHYVSERTKKTTEPNDSARLGKLLMPGASGSRGLKNSSRLDSKEKQRAETKPRPLKSGKPPIPSRTLPKKGDSTSSRPNASDAMSSDHSAKGSVGNDDNESGEQSLTGLRSSNTEVTSGGTMVFSSQAFPSESRKKALTRNTTSERLNKGKAASTSAKLAKPESNENLISEASEPRRSNRRIQPTSRLLEGLQSSLIISKLPSSHDKGQRSHSRGGSKGNNNRG